MLDTETPDPRHPELDLYDARTMARAFVTDQARAAEAVLAAHEQIARAVEAAVLRALQACDFHVKTAIVMLRKSVPPDAARAALDAAGGSVRAALGESRARR